MSDEFNIIEEKTDSEKKMERLEKKLKRMMEADRVSALIRSEIADIDIVVGALIQTKGLIQMDRALADDVEEHLEDMLLIAKDMIRCMNEKTAKRKGDGIDE